MNNLQSTMRQQKDLLTAEARYLVANFWEDEEGDTNFVSILVLLGIALGVAAVFLTFRDRIVEWLEAQMNMFGNQNASSSVNHSNITNSTTPR